MALGKSIGANFRTALRRPLGRELTALLALKLVALIAIYVVFFGPETRIVVTPTVVEHALTAAPMLERGTEAGR